MKKLAIIIGLLLLASDVWANEKNPLPGKFQIIIGEYEITDNTMMDGNIKNETRNKKVVLKLNTETGETWVLNDITATQATTGKGLSIMKTYGWAPIKNSEYKQVDFK